MYGIVSKNTANRKKRFTVAETERAFLKPAFCPARGICISQIVKGVFRHFVFM